MDVGSLLFPFRGLTCVVLTSWLQRLLNLETTTAFDDNARRTTTHGEKPKSLDGPPAMALCLVDGTMVTWPHRRLALGELTEKLSRQSPEGRAQ